jgi:hypothetical protein
MWWIRLEKLRSMVSYSDRPTLQLLTNRSTDNPSVACARCALCLVPSMQMNMLMAYMWMRRPSRSLRRAQLPQVMLMLLRLAPAMSLVWAVSQELQLPHAWTAVQRALVLARTRDMPTLKRVNRQVSDRAWWTPVVRVRLAEALALRSPLRPQQMGGWTLPRGRMPPRWRPNWPRQLSKSG